MAQKTIKKQEHSYTVIYGPVKEGGYQVTVPLLPGLITYGRTFGEARKMAKDAIICCLEGFAEEKEIIPEEIGLLQERIMVYA